MQAAHAAGLDRLDTQLLLLHTLGRSARDRAWLTAHDDDRLTETLWSGFDTLCQRRLAGEPVAYLVGEKEFFGLTLQVDARVLVPRPDTETLVEWALDVLASAPMPQPPEPVRLIDLGTGSGAVVLALAQTLAAQSRPARCVAVDLSAGALAVARANAEAASLNVQFGASHWLREVSGHFHLIVSNPPYIAEGDPHLDALSHEPRTALTSGADGLDDLREIVRQAPGSLLPGGWLLLEHGHDQPETVRQLLQARGFTEVQSRRDLAGTERCSGGRWPLADA